MYARNARVQCTLRMRVFNVRYDCACLIQAERKSYVFNVRWKFECSMYAGNRMHVFNVRAITIRVFNVPGNAALEYDLQQEQWFPDTGLQDHSSQPRT